MEYRLGKNMASVRIFEALHLRAGQVLEEYGLDGTDVLRAVAFCGSDMDLPFISTDGVRFQWCVPHLLNHTIVQPFRLAITPESSEHRAAQAVIKKKKYVKYVSSSDQAQARHAACVE